MVLKIAAIALIAVLSAMTVRHERPDIAVALGIAGGAAVLIAVIDGITDLTAMLTELAEKTGVGGDLIVYLMKLSKNTILIIRIKFMAIWLIMLRCQAKT